MDMNKIMRRSGHTWQESFEALKKFTLWLDKAHKPDEYQTLAVLQADFTENLDPDQQITTEEFIGLLAIFRLRVNKDSQRIYKI